MLYYRAENSRPITLFSSHSLFSLILRSVWSCCHHCRLSLYCYRYRCCSAITASVVGLLNILVWLSASCKHQNSKRLYSSSELKRRRWSEVEAQLKGLVQVRFEAREKKRKREANRLARLLAFLFLFLSLDVCLYSVLASNGSKNRAGRERCLEWLQLKLFLGTAFSKVCIVIGLLSS